MFNPVVTLQIAPGLRWPILATCLAGVLYVYVLIRVGKARKRLKVSPLQTTAPPPPEFQAIHRVQINQSEQMVHFIPMMWLFSIFVDPFVGGILGIAWCVLRFGYTRAYTEKYHVASIVRYTVPCYLILQAYTIGLFVVAAMTFVDGEEKWNFCRLFDGKFFDGKDMWNLNKYFDGEDSWNWRKYFDGIDKWDLLGCGCGSSADGVGGGDEL
eukprot:TRINITY_DN6829_c0_g1_i2.p1 TRINITY_DN6829_c0_g1~~TRINITY_DN6829_c0_g1_i2.p1  ORF type:complete len:212 (+),score=33.85 TRINITY_DN6829_c0_g1_i2:22-657(+)